MRLLQTVLGQAVHTRQHAWQLCHFTAGGAHTCGHGQLPLLVCAPGNFAGELATCCWHVSVFQPSCSQCSTLELCIK